MNYLACNLKWESDRVPTKKFPDHQTHRCFSNPPPLGQSPVVLALTLAAICSRVVISWGQTPPSEDIPSLSPIAAWNFDNADDADPLIPVKTVGNLSSSPGPRPPWHPRFLPGNRGGSFDGKTYLRFQDPGKDSVFDFGLGDTITLEAWIRPSFIADNQQTYLIGKGRTGRKGFPAENQNWALRLRGKEGAALVSFLFRSSSEGDVPAEFQRWNTTRGVQPDGRWHHVAVSFQFGNAESINAWIDGRQVGGSWDLGTHPNAAPVVDDDEIWIGSSLGGNPNSSYIGDLDQIQIYRGRIPTKEMEARGRSPMNPPPLVPLADTAIQQQIVVEILESLPQERSWLTDATELTERFEWSHMALVETPPKYNARGIRIERSNPYLVRMRGRVRLPREGTGLLRSKNAARLWIKNQIVAETGFMSRNSSGHEAVPDLLPPKVVGMHPVPPGHQEITFEIDETLAGEQMVVIETIVGGKGIRPEIGDLCFAVQETSGPFIIASSDPHPSLELSSESWLRWETSSLRALQEINQKLRREKQLGETAYWKQRHVQAREYIDSLPPITIPTSDPTLHPIDAWIQQGLQRNAIEASGPIDDLRFLRRLYLDTVGVPPSLEEIETFLSVPQGQRRPDAIDRVLGDPRWADHWVSYWQDVLAENPGLLKPELNNTGPFRYWIYESFRDNKAMDRFATELIRMEGSRLGGGPAGFAMASQNDVPMAAKGVVLTQAFLGVNMTCARCHDSPDRISSQKDLFSIAALLERRPIALPETSTVPARSDGTSPNIPVSLSPGDRIPGNWPFQTEPWSLGHASLELPTHADSRDRLAFWITAPQNHRFAQVIANRLWARWLGRGIMEPVDDWETATASHPILLEWLGRQLISANYDLKHLARLILNSQTYQNEVVDSTTKLRWFAGPARRRLTAEQLVDSLHSIAGKTMGAERLTLDPEGRRPASSFLNLGVPTRAWNYVGLSNERDRPALALPHAQGVIDMLVAFGWRESRPNPVSSRDHSPMVLQPLVVANGDAAHRLTQFSEDSWFTDWSLKAPTPEAWLQGVFLRTLTRYPTPAELEDYVPYLRRGYEKRRLVGEVPRKMESQFRNAVSWSNHLHPDATSIKLKLEAKVREGDLPTALLTQEWREAAEDVVWVLLNSPELVYVP